MSMPHRSDEDPGTHGYSHREVQVESSRTFFQVPPNRRRISHRFSDSTQESSRPPSAFQSYSPPHHYYHPRQPNLRPYFIPPGPPRPPPVERSSGVPPAVYISRFTNEHNNRPAFPLVTPPRLRGNEQISEAGDNDVLCGRGAPTTWHPGNRFFRERVQSYQSAYLASRRSDKPLIATRIIEEVKSRGGRFLKRCKRNGVSQRGHFVWVEIGEQRAYEKACQALREGAPEIRRQLLLKNAGLSTSREGEKGKKNRNDGSSEGRKR